MDDPGSLIPFAAALIESLEAADEIVAVLRVALPGLDELRVEAASGGFCSLFGETEAALRGRPFTHLFIAATAAAEEVSRALQRNTIARVEMACITHRAHRVWLGFKLLPMNGGKPGLKRYVLIGRETTSLRIAAEQERAIQTLFVGAFQQIDTALAITNLEGVVQLANPALHRTLGFPVGALVGRQMLDMAEPADRLRLAEAQVRQRQDGRGYSINLRLLHLAGGSIGFKATVSMGTDASHRFRVITYYPLADAPAPAIVPASPVPDAPVRVKVGGKIQLLGLEAVRAKLGDGWPAQAARTMDLAEHILRRRLDRTDMFSRSGECGFAISFANADEEEAGFRAAMIGREIRQRLLGDAETSEVAQVSAIVATVQPAAGETVDLMTISRVIEERRAVLEQRARETFATALRDTRCEPEAVLLQGRSSGLAWLGMAASARRRITSAAGVLGTDPGDVDQLALDLSIEHVIDGALQGGAGAGPLGGFLISIDLESLAGKRAATACVAKLRRVDPVLRSSIIVMLGEQDDAPSPRRLEEAVLLFKPLGVKLGLEFRTLQRPALESAPASFGMLSLPAPVLAKLLKSDAKGTAKLIAGLRARGMRLIGRHARGREEAQSLGAMGVDLVTVLPAVG